MILRDDILSEIEKELDYLLAEASEHLSAKARKAIRAESIGHAKHVLD